VLRARNGRLPKVTARNLTVDTAARFLIRNKLIDASAIIEGDVEIVDASRRNQSLKIVRRHGPSYFLKQAGEGEPDSRATIGREAWFYHDIRLMSPEYVRPCVKAQKNDDRDAEGIAEAATRPTMRFARPLRRGHRLVATRDRPQQQVRDVAFPLGFCACPPRADG
jgi:hypothetical protein